MPPQIGGIKEQKAESVGGGDDKSQHHDLQRHAHHHPIDPHAQYQYHPTYRRLSTDFAYNQKVFLLTFQTNSYRSETSWFLHSNANNNGG